jgi:hypothetical protein
MVCRKRELDKVALFRGSVVRSDGDVEQELPASSTADRKHPGDEPRLAIMVVPGRDSWMVRTSSSMPGSLVTA